VQADSPVKRPGTGRRPQAPLRRRPKQLDAEPRLLEAAPAGSGGAGGLIVPGRTGRGTRPQRPPPGSAAPTVTEDQATLAGVPDGEITADP